MMKCEELQQQLDDYLDGKLDSRVVSVLEKHVSCCASCTDLVDSGKSVQQGLKQLAEKANTVSDEFIAAAFEKVRDQYPEKASNNKIAKIGIKTGFVTALAAGFSLWAVLSTFILPGIDSTTSADVAVMNLAVDQAHVVRIAIDTLDEFDNVTFSVELPKHVELKGHKNKRKLSWDAKLTKGSNILRIPLKAIRYGQGEFTARITHNGKEKTFKLYLQSKKPDLTRFNATQLQV